MNRTKKLFSNFAVFIVGNLGSKLISFLMVPLYTYYLNSKQFGTVDLLLTTINLCLPLITFSLFDAVFRFVMDKDIDNVKVISTGFFTTLVLFALSVVLFPILSIFNIPYLVLFFLILFVTATFTMFQNYVRASGSSRIFAFSGVINTLVFASTNLILLVFFNGGVRAYLGSYLVAIIVATLYIVFRTHLWKTIKLTEFSYSLLKRMLKYSVPLIPNSLAWWFTNDSSRYFILIFVGISGNGLFAVANKIPTIINMFFSVFTQAWQISAVDEFKSSDNESYYSDVFEKLLRFLFLLVYGIMFVLKPAMKLLFDANYYIAWQYVPILLIAVLLADASAFLGTIYLAAEKTANVFSTTVLGMVVNVLLGALLTPAIGIFGTGISMSLGFLVVIMLRLRSVKTFVEVKMPWKVFSILLIDFLIMYGGLFIKNSGIEYAVLVMGLTVAFIVNFNFISSAFHAMRSILKK